MLVLAPTLFVAGPERNSARGHRRKQRTAIDLRLPVATRLVAETALVALSSMQLVLTSGCSAGSFVVPLFV